MQRIGSIVVFSALTALSGAPLAQAQWTSNTDIFFAAGDDASITGVRWLKPWWQNGKAMAYSDARVLYSDKDTEEFNLGGGYRSFNADDTALYGGYGFLDYRLSASNRKYSQMTFGGEYLTPTWDYRANLYLPLKDEYVVATLRDQVSESTVFEGHTVKQTTTTVPGGKLVEEALQGFDLEVGRLLPTNRYEIRAYLAAYHFEADIAGEANGLRGRLEAFPIEDFQISFSIESDDLYDTRTFLELSAPLGKKFGRKVGFRSLSERMTQFAYRDIDVRETSRLAADVRTKNGPGSKEARKNTTTVTQTLNEDPVVHIDSTASTTGDGTFESPYQSIADCESGAGLYHCNNVDSVSTTIYLHASSDTTGDTIAQDNQVAQTYIGNLQLQTNQDLIGDGITSGIFADIATGIHPILLGSDSAAVTYLVSAGLNSEIGGLQLGWSFADNIGADNDDPDSDLNNPDGTPDPLPAGTAMPDTAIFAADTESLVIRDINITGYGQQDAGLSESNNFVTGIHLLSTTGQMNTTIDTSIVSLNLGNGIFAEATSTAGGTVSQNLTLRNSVVFRNGRGIHATVDGTDGSRVDQLVRVAAKNPSETNLVNNIFQNQNEGILQETLRTDIDTSTFEANQTLIVEDTLLEDNQGAGIKTLYSKNSAGEASTVELDNVNLFQNEGSGLDFENIGGVFTASLKNVSLLGNIEKPQTTVFGRRLDGAAIDCERGGDCSVQAANAARVADHNSGFGIYMENDDSASFASTQSVVISENFLSGLHDSAAAQIYVFSDSVDNSASLQTVNLLRAEEEDPDSTFSKLLTNWAGTVVVQSGGNLTVELDNSTTSPEVRTCDGDESDPPQHVSLDGQLEELENPAEEECL